MNICVVGLGLIGGSFCKAITSKSEHKCYGIDTNRDVIDKAVKDNVIMCGISADRLKEMDLCVICLYPKATNEFIINNIDNFKKDSIVIDSCGIKQAITQTVEDLLFDNNINFIGCHPMAGREFSGYDYSLSNLFENASFIMTPSIKASADTVETVENLARMVGFTNIVIATPKEHDRIIAFTSQLAHITSSAYIKSPTLKKCKGFSAGSFQDLTRVAKLNENMWTDLFLLNSDALSSEIENIISELSKYKQAIDNKEYDTLYNLLKDGRILKEQT